MEDAKDVVRKRLGQVKAFLAQEAPPKLSESDTKANFIEPIISALGWEGIGVVTREYYVKNSQEFIDYVMAGPSGLLLAIEAKPLQTELTDKHAAQLIQYCAVEGIEWAALTNGRELQFFNSFLKPDLGAKRVLRLDLLAFNSDAEFDALFSQIWQLSRESMTTPSGVRTWLNQRRLDATLRGVLLDSSSPIFRQLRKVLADAEVTATTQDIAQWFRRHLSPQALALPKQPTMDADREPLPDPVGGSPSGDTIRATGQTSLGGRSGSVGKAGAAAARSPLFLALRNAIDSRLPGVNWRSTSYYVAVESEGQTFLAARIRQHYLILGLALPASASSSRFEENSGDFKWARMTKIVKVSSDSAIDDELLNLVQEACAHSIGVNRTKAHFGISLRELIEKRYLQPGVKLALVGQAGREVAHARLTESGEIAWNGSVYRSPSDKNFAKLIGRQSLNGWNQWYIALPEGKTSLAEIRERMQGSSAPYANSESPAAT